MPALAIDRIYQEISASPAPLRKLMNPEAKEFTERLQVLKAEESRAYKRAILYTLIPIFVGLMVVGFLAWEAVKLERRREVAIKETARAQSDLNDAKAKLAGTTEALKEAKDTLNKTKKQLEGKGDQHAVVELNKALTTIDTIGSGRWVVISGDSGDNALARAQRHVQEAQKLGYPNVAIYLRQNSYRTVIEFKTEAEAKASLADIHARLSPDAYLRDLTKWCSHPTEQNGYFQCPE
jgi:hypothetical protein